MCLPTLCACVTLVCHIGEAWQGVTLKWQLTYSGFHARCAPWEWPAELRLQTFNVSLGNMVTKVYRLQGLRVTSETGGVNSITYFCMAAKGEILWQDMISHLVDIWGIFLHVRRNSNRETLPNVYREWSWVSKVVHAKTCNAGNFDMVPLFELFYANHNTQFTEGPIRTLYFSLYLAVSLFETVNGICHILDLSPGRENYQHVDKTAQTKY